MILVTGATGAVGPRVVETLLKTGHRVRTYSLDPPQPGVSQAGCEARAGDILDANALQQAMQGCAAVIHMAALLHVVNPPPSLRPKYQSINVEGTRQVIQAAIETGLKRIVFFSTIAVYGDSPSGALDEESPTFPSSFYAQSKKEAEQLVLSAHNANGQPLGTVLRLGAIYGAKIKGNYHKLVNALARGRFIPLGKGMNRRTLVYDRDVARAALLAATHPDAAGRIYNVTDGTFHSLSEIIATICSALGRPQPKIQLPVAPVRWAAGVADDMAKMVGLRSPIGRATIDKYLEEVCVSGQQIQNELGFKPQYNLEGGWKETIAEMRAAGTLPN